MKNNNNKIDNLKKSTFLKNKILIKIIIIFRKFFIHNIPVNNINFTDNKIDRLGFFFFFLF